MPQSDKSTANCVQTTQIMHMLVGGNGSVILLTGSQNQLTNPKLTTGMSFSSLLKVSGKNCFCS